MQVLRLPLRLAMLAQGSLRMTILGGKQIFGGVFPLELGGEAMAGEAGVGVGLEEAEVADGGLGEFFERDEAVQCVDGPAGPGGVVAAPVEGGLPGFVAEGGPALGEPEFGTGIAALFDEGKV